MAHLASPGRVRSLDPNGPVFEPPRTRQALRAPLRGRVAVTEPLQPYERLSIGIARPLLDVRQGLD